MTIETLDIVGVQAKLIWHKPEENQAHIAKLLSKIEGADLIILPEMWASGFTMKAEAYASYTPASLGLMKKWSEQSGAVIAGSLICEEEGAYYNRLYVVDKGRLIGQYDKKHLFAYSGEDRYFTPGQDIISLNIRGWKVRLNICYDLRFPVWCRNHDNCDLYIFTANWPKQRIEAWNILLKARAIENQAYVAGINCVGEDAWHNVYNGHSAIVGYDGQIIANEEGKEALVRTQISKSKLFDFRQNLPFLKDQDSFEIKEKDH